MLRFIATCAILAVSTAALASPPPAIPETPAAVHTLVYAQPFSLEEGYRFDWRAEHPTVVEGYILVLKVDPDLVYPRQMPEPVLYVGDQTVERVNIGHKSGHVIAILPEKIDLATAPIWFGTPDLPERVDAEIIAAERARAEAAGIEPFAAAAVDASLRAGGEAVSFESHDHMLHHLATLIQTYAPEERILAESFLMIRL